MVDSITGFSDFSSDTILHPWFEKSTTKFTIHTLKPVGVTNTACNVANIKSWNYFHFDGNLETSEMTNNAAL